MVRGTLTFTPKPGHGVSRDRIASKYTSTINLPAPSTLALLNRPILPARCFCQKQSNDFAPSICILEPRMIRLIVYWLLLVWLATACCPIPTYEKEAPNIDGTLVRQNSSAANVLVFLAVNKEISSGCSRGRRETRTDANGKFHFDYTGYQSPILVFYGSPRYDRWSLCFRFPDGVEAAWSYRDMFGGAPIQRIVCQIDNTPQSVNAPLELSTSKSGQFDANSCQVENIRATPTPKR